MNPSPAATRGSNRAEQFYHQFKHETAGKFLFRQKLPHAQSPANDRLVGLDDSLAELSKLPAADVERVEGLAECTQRLQRVSEEVQDASSWLPSHDRKTYADALGGLADRLLQAKKAGAVAKPKFAFRPGRKVAAAGPAPQAARSATSSDSRPVESGIRSGLGDHEETNVSGAREGGRGEQALRSENQVSGPLIAKREHEIVRLPVGGADVATTAHVSDIKQCVIDLSGPHRERGVAFANLNVKDMGDSVLLGGAVMGAVHLSKIKHSIVLVSTHQFRMHDCRNTTVYLHCTSQPIIDDCDGILFAPLPVRLRSDAPDTARKNMWDQVQDFKWLKKTVSPNWRILRDEEKIGDITWAKFMLPDGEFEAEDLLQDVGLGEPAHRELMPASSSGS